MSPVEIAATIFGVLSVGFTIRQSIWCWPTGLVMVTLYIFVFWDAKLYSDMGLQVVYIFLQLYGWYHWLHGGKDRDSLPVTRLSPLQAAAWLIGAAASTFALGWVMSTKTDAALPYWDATTTVLSLVAQWLMARKLLESWVLWITVDVLSIGIYYNRELYLTSGLYAVFLVMATAGLVAWYLSWRAEPTPFGRGRHGKHAEGTEEF